MIYPYSKQYSIGLSKVLNLQLKGITIVTKKFKNLMLLLLISIIIGCSVLYMSNGWYEMYYFWGIDSDSIFLFVIYHLMFIFPLILLIITSKKKTIRILGLLSILCLIYPLMIVCAGLPQLGISIDYSIILHTVSLSMLLILLLLVLFIDKNINLVFKIYIISLIFYAFITLLNSFGLLTNILSVLNIPSHSSNIYNRIAYLIKQDFIIYSSWVCYFIFLRDNLFINKNTINKQISIENFIWLWLFFGFLGLERIYYSKNKNITNFQLISTSCYVPLIIYRDIASVLSLNNSILYYLLIVIFVCKILVWIYSLVQFLMINKEIKKEIIQDEIVL